MVKEKESVMITIGIISIIAVGYLWVRYNLNTLITLIGWGLFMLLANWLIKDKVKEE